ncbi:FxSxx-COOH system tetratricopeptide repeat protein [Plantactinospora sp. WMMB334]|uniref:FxSxx-COOH system tetratricopeptide repeat protein n=1 Tax=Plantactinospora sp. WMMB334 TaxID=3404119 RepID=UPI003B937657
MGDAASGKDFFISYATENRAWAEWIAVQLEQAGYSTVYQSADFRPGRDFVFEMQGAVTSARRMIAVLTPAYLVSVFGGAEWRAMYLRDPTGERGLLLPVRVQPCEPTGFLASRVYADLVDTDEPAARKKLLAAVDEDRPRPSMVDFPGRGGMRFPGAGPVVTNLPTRNPVFTGRSEVIQSVWEGLRTGGPSAVVSGAVHGLGGVGKTAVATEYGYRFGSDYDVVWWVDAQQPATVPAQLTGLGRRLGVLPEMVDDQDAVAAVFDHLRGRDRWLLVYDNAERPSSLSGLIPAGGAGHVLVTSRWPDWRARGRVVRLEVWSREESVAFLRARTQHVDERLLGELAELVGDLPLAVEEAATYLSQTGEDLAVYLELVRERSRELFAVSDAAEGADGRRVATVWTLSLTRVGEDQPLAGELLKLLAFLAPRVPRQLPAAAPDTLPAELAAAVTDRLAHNRLLDAVGRYALVGLDPDVIEMHRLVQAVVQARLGREQEEQWATAAVTLIRQEFPDDSREPVRWPSCQQLLPHLLAVTGHARRLGVAAEEVGWLLAGASSYLRERGQYQQAEPLARDALTITRSALGPDHIETANRHDALGGALRDLGRLEEAHAQYQQALTISLTALGPDHPNIGSWRNNLGGVLRDLGRLEEAHTQFQQALTIGLTALGPDHPDIGIRRNNLGNVLRDLGRLEEAHTQYQQALTISLTALGPDHPQTRTIRDNLDRLEGRE